MVKYHFFSMLLEEYICIVKVKKNIYFSNDLQIFQNLMILIKRFLKKKRKNVGKQRLVRCIKILLKREEGDKINASDIKNSRKMKNKKDS